MKKRLLSALLALCMMLTMMPTVAFAAEGTNLPDAGAEGSGRTLYVNPVYTNDSDTIFKTLSEAVERAQPGDTIQLVDDVRSKPVTIVTSNLTLDLNTYTLRADTTTETVQTKTNPTPNPDPTPAPDTDATAPLITLDGDADQSFVFTLKNGTISGEGYNGRAFYASQSVFNISFEGVSFNGFHAQKHGQVLAAARFM